MKKSLLLHLPVILIAVLLSSCSRNNWVKNEGEVFGTYYHLVYESPQGQNLNDVVMLALDSVNRALSTYDSTSVISRFNRSKKGIEYTNAHFRKVFSAASRITDETNGAFDMTVAPLVNAWGFGFSQRQNITPSLIDSLRMLVGMDNITIKGDSLLKSMPGIMLDASAIAKGYGVDVAAKVLEQNGCKNYLVEIGGEITTKGMNQKNIPWRIGIDKPIDDPSASDRKIQMVVQLSGKSMATSGNYRQFYIDKKTGKKYAHTIDPLSGEPVQHSLLSATIIADDCMTADAYATACMVLGLEKSHDLLRQHPELDGCFIHATNDGMEVSWTEGFEKYFITN
jgi:thiamine biosynthesis lipoprotein